MSALGRHILIEIYNCNPAHLDAVTHVEKSLIEAARAVQATIINTSFHHFSPYGVSGVVVIQESHFTIHTWPEYGFASLDIFTCGDEINPWDALSLLEQSFGASHSSAVEMRRGERSLLQKKDFIPTTQPRKPSLSPQRQIWFTQRTENLAFSMRYDGELLFAAQSPYQKVEVYKSYALGRCLVLDGQIVASEKEEAVYHEMLTHIALLTHENPQHICIVGGGDGGTAREVLRHEQVQSVLMFEIDAIVIEAAKKALPTMASALQHPKLHIQIADALTQMQHLKTESMDVILLDAADSVLKHEGLHTHDFLNHTRRVLKANGILVLQHDASMPTSENFQTIRSKIEQVFEQPAFPYLAHPAQATPNVWAFLLIRKTPNPKHPKEIDIQKIKPFLNANQDLYYYNSEIHSGAFALPNFMKI
ncbi:MAG: adenosylmethionine decarboxylase [Bernardetiaceae bacterium]|nr:adenosylmethionine decarboxylase [Bernardetiaceae bacterium]